MQNCLENVYLFLKVVDDRLYGGTFIVLLDIRLQQVVCNLFSLQKETLMRHMNEIKHHTRTYSRLYRALLPIRIRTPDTTVESRTAETVALQFSANSRCCTTKDSDSPRTA